MGIGSSSSNLKVAQIEADMSVELFSNHVKAGDFIVGKIHIRLKEILFDPQLMLILKGHEITNFKTESLTTNSQTQETITYTVHHTGKNNFAKI